MAILDRWTVDFVSTGVAQTVRLGVRLGELLQVGNMVCLSGDLGAGKTTLAQGVGRGWGTAVRVTSPTFTLVNQYPRLKDGRILYHIDCYRLESPGDVATAGLEDIFDDDGAYLIEWAERITPILPTDRLTIELGYINETKRNLHLAAIGSRSAELLETFRRSAFGV